MPWDDDVQHINALPRLGNVHVAFGVLIHCFAYRCYYFFVFSPIPIFLAATTFLWFNFHFCIWETHKAKLCPNVPIVHWQAFFPISRGEISLVFMKIIAPTTYLRNWGLVAPTIVSNFLQDDHPFLLGFIGASNRSAFPFHGHLRWVHHDFLLPNA